MTHKVVYVDKEHSMKIVTCNLPRKHLAYINKLLEWGIVPSRSEYVRVAVANQIRNDFETKGYVEEVIEETIDNKTFIKIPGYNGDKPVEIIRRLEY